MSQIRKKSKLLKASKNLFQIEKRRYFVKTAIILSILTEEVNKNFEAFRSRF